MPETSYQEVWNNCLSIIRDNVTAQNFKTWFKPWDAWYGIIKGLSFGVAITSIACYFGYYTKGGAEGVGKSATSTVVISCIAIMVLDYVLASLLL